MSITPATLKATLQRHVGTIEMHPTFHSCETWEIPAENVKYVYKVSLLNQIHEIGVTIKTNKKVLKVKINDCLIKMEFDTGAPTDIVSKRTLNEMKISLVNLDPSDKQLMSCSKHAA